MNVLLLYNVSNLNETIDTHTKAIYFLLQEKIKENKKPQGTRI